jgi:hypothetical protein
LPPLVQRSLLLTAVLASGLALLTGCSSPRLPPSSATAVEVTKVYLAAAKAQRCDVTKALTLDNTWAWCRNPTLRKYTVADKAESVPFNPGHTTESCVDTTVTSRASGEAEPMNGTRAWSFCYTKTASGWRLTDQGQG